MSLRLLLALLLTTTSPTPTEDLLNHHLEVGNNALAASDFPTAISHYKSCLDIDPNHRYCLINYASALVDSIDPNEEASSKDGTNNRAIEMLRRVLESHPQDGDAAFNLAILLQDTSRSEEITQEAAKLYQISAESSLESGEQRWDAWANLASAQQELGVFLGQYGAHASYERSIVYLERITKQHQAYIHEILHSPHAAELEWDEARYEEISAELWEMNHFLSKLYYGLGTILSELSPQDCLRLMDQDTLLINAMIEEDDEEAAKKVCNENAVNAMRLAVDLDPENRVAQHMLDAMVGEEGDGSKRASNEFVSALFDDFADTFDEKLGALNYQVPSLVGEAAYYLLKSEGRETYRSALDAGCGTGLVGRFLKPLVDGPLVGVDLSTKMLDLARECTLVKGCGLKEGAEEEEKSDDRESDGDAPAESEDERASVRLYNHLVSLDLETATIDELYSGYNDTPADAKDGFELIVAADVLVYFGDLQKLITNFAALSAKSNDEREAFLIFSCERIEEEDAPSNGWKLQNSGRYAHSKSYVVKTAREAGYRLVTYEEIVPRMEKGKEVQGHLFQFAHGLDDYVDEDDIETDLMVYMDIIDENGNVAVVRDEL